MLKMLNRFPGGIVPTKNYVAADKAISQTIKEDSMLAIIGSTGMGKSTIRRIATGKMEEKGHIVIMPDVSSTKGREVSGAIASRMIEELSGEKARRDIIARSTQLKRLLITNAKKRKIILILDESQDLERDTIYGIKKMHELGGNQNREYLFSVIFFGQDRLAELITPLELSLRIDSIELQELKIEEAKQFLEFNGLKLDRHAINRIFANRENKIPAGINRTCKLLSHYFELKNGKNKNLNNQDIIKFYSRNLKDQIKESGLSYRQLSSRIYKKHKRLYDASVISRGLEGKLKDKNREAQLNQDLNDIVQEAIAGKKIPTRENIAKY